MPSEKEGADDDCADATDDGSPAGIVEGVSVVDAFSCTSGAGVATAGAVVPSDH